MTSRLLESFKSSEFDVDFFVSESLRSSPASGILDQLKRCDDELEHEAQNLMKETIHIVRSYANRADSTLGTLLSMREHTGEIKQTLELLRNEERTRLNRLRQKLNQLKVAHELSQLTKSRARIAG